MVSAFIGVCVAYMMNQIRFVFEGFTSSFYIFFACFVRDHDVSTVFVGCDYDLAFFRCLHFNTMGYGVLWFVTRCANAFR